MISGEGEYDLFSCSVCEERILPLKGQEVKYNIGAKGRNMEEEKNNVEKEIGEVKGSMNELKTLMEEFLKQSANQAKVVNTNSSAPEEDNQEEEEHPSMQLWKGGPRWATCNVGAEEDWEVGDYLAWGELEPRMEYSEWSHKWFETPENWT
ncbi:MAG TPA: hypothetical protein DDY68_05995, partial [Porphyromonadaceae bacterium]|nr:hypothetical protein [Porphyromonadaceae bacterium]